MSSWTPLLVADQLEEAADVLKRMPPVMAQGYFSTWPEMKQEFSDLVGQEPRSMKRHRPTTKAITHMEEAIHWTVGLDVMDAKIIWLRARKKRWKEICWRVGLSRTNAHKHWLYGLCVISWRLNNVQITPHGSMQELIVMTTSTLKDKKN